MISDPDIWRTALAMVRKYGEGAMLEADRRSDQFRMTVTGKVQSGGTGS
jgi:hypothetical protein